MSTVPTRLDAAEHEAYRMRISLAWRELRRGASASALREYLHGKSEDAIDQGQIDTLDVLASQPLWRMSELADALHVEPSTATRAVQRLVAEGLAERLRDADDGRVVKVRISAAGRAVRNEVVERRATMFRFILDNFTDDELPHLAELLERFTNAIDAFAVLQRDAD